MMGFKFSRSERLALVALAGILLLGLGYAKMRNTAHALDVQDRISVVPTGTIASSASEGSQPSMATPAPEDLPSIVVHVAGRVKNPGVYSLKPGSRVVDAVHMAGGPTADADLDSINLAAGVRDGVQIMVSPKQMQTGSSAVPASYVRSSGSGASSAGAILVNINTAGAKELEQLPGVGPATAENIIEYRRRVGRFGSVEQLDEVSGIGPAKLEKMRPYVRL